MHVSELISPTRVRVPLEARDKAGVLRELVGLLVAGDRRQGAEVLGAILERERQFPTGVGYGVAVPHAKTPALPTLGLVAGTTLEPVDYEAIDGKPVRIFFLLAGPDAAGPHVRAISRLSRLVRQEPVRAQLLAAPTADAFYRVLCDADGTLAP
jgi:mannitol/fructose-specific phosphotransferase system IIA component (Ntr-type)